MTISKGESTHARIHRLTQIYQTLSEHNHAIIRISDEKELFPMVCKIAVEYGGVSMAWVGISDPESEHIVPIASYGANTDYLKTLRISTHQDQAEEQVPLVTAYRGNHSVVINKWPDEPLSTQLPGQAKHFHWGSCGSFPIPRNGQPFAVLSVYHEEENFFDSDTVNLLDEMAYDLTFALDIFDRDQARRDALEALQANEQRFRAYFERAMFGMAAILPDKNWLEVNQALCDMFGYTYDEFKTLSWVELTHPDDRETSQTLLNQLIEGSVNDFMIEKRYIRKSGDVVDGLLAARAVRNADASLAYIVVLVENITRRKMEERREQMRRLALETVARGSSLDEIMLQVIESAEAIYPQSMCSILLMNDDGTHLQNGAAPSLPDFYNELTAHLKIGPGVGSCGTSAFTGERTIVEDISSHPYWENNREVAARAGLAACWSEPILSKSGKVLGTFAIYRQKPGRPDDQEIALIENAGTLMGIAIERVRSQEELYLAAAIYRNSSEAVLVTDAQNKIIAINPAFVETTGYTLEEIKGKDPAILHSGRHDADFFQAMWQNIEEQGSWQGEVWNRRKDGGTFPEWLTINTIYTDTGDVHCYVAMGSDITNKIRSDEVIWRQANYDFLTDLPNRYMFQDRLEQEIRKSRRERSMLALLFIDLDHFKDVNDTLGHPVGDQLLVKTAERILHCVRGADTVARMGGDEFTVILRDLTQTIDAEKVAEQIISELAAPYFINGETIYAPASIGISFCPGDASDVDQLISNADQAMYASKTSGRNRISYFTRTLQESAQKRLSLITDMRVAVEKNEFELYFQPIINLNSGLIVKAEALIRWNHPEHGIISPVEFIPLAEESGLIVGIGDWVFRDAAAKAKRWVDLFDAGVPVSINVSPVQFQSETLNITEWLTHLRTLGLDEKYLSIEITEGLLLNASKDVKDKLLQFRDAGIQVAIDDFGVGYSALSYLKRFDIDFLKIDQSFIRSLETDQNDLALSEAIVIMAHKLGLKVTAEGVETDAQRRLLLDIGCDNGQGYLFSRPLPAEEFEAFLINSMKPV
ncbi:EAL domain-containing protein [Marinobacter sp. ANT_B65]|uniref:bifunctional diguanylate cyclase/phosphodiesterase n=1 Tax=Marinobacter sp. ANT_B65 TaxID=2039467 RepID=UPI0015C74273|nr:EAL domain-containing protein [Marinobacter sp. ANT_B65]